MEEPQGGATAPDGSVPVVEDEGVLYEFRSYFQMGTEEYNKLSVSGPLSIHCYYE